MNKLLRPALKAIAVLSLLCPLSCVKAQNPQVASTDDGGQAAQKQQLQNLTSVLQEQSGVQPKIHTQSYCAQLPASQQNSCINDNSYGLKLYQALRASQYSVAGSSFQSSGKKNDRISAAKEYQSRFQGMSLKKFGEELLQLSTLRDGLWQTQSFGGVLLADLTNRIIYWRLINRATFATVAELKSLDPMRSYYRDLSSDWRVVAEAVGTEINQPVDLVALDKANATKRVDWKIYEGRGKLGLRYLDILEQLQSSPSQNDEGFVASGADVSSILQSLVVKPHVLTLLDSYSRRACNKESMPARLRYYMSLMRQLRGRAEFSAGLVTATTPSSSPREKEEKARAMRRKSQALEKRLKDLIPEIIPEALNENVSGCEKALTWYDFANMISIVQSQHDVTYRDPNLESSAEFEMLFP